VLSEKGQTRTFFVIKEVVDGAPLDF